jgi:hypothetical protein
MAMLINVYPLYAILVLVLNFKECIVLCLFVLLYSFPSQHDNVKTLTHIHCVE